MLVKGSDSLALLQIILRNFYLFLLAEAFTNFVELLTHLLQLPNRRLHLLVETLEVLVNVDFHLLHAERFDLEPKGHPLKELIFKILQKDQPVLLGSNPKAKVPVLLNWIEKQLLASVDLSLPLLSQLGRQGYFLKKDTLTAEVASEARLFLSMGEVPPKKPQEERDIEVVSVYLVESHHLLQHVIVRFGVVPDCITLKDGVFLIFRSLVQLLRNILHRHIQIFPPNLVGRLP